MILQVYAYIPQRHVQVEEVTLRTVTEAPVELR